MLVKLLSLLSSTEVERERKFQKKRAYKIVWDFRKRFVSPADSVFLWEGSDSEGPIELIEGLLGNGTGSGIQNGMRVVLET